MRFTHVCAAGAASAALLLTGCSSSGSGPAASDGPSAVKSTAPATSAAATSAAPTDGGSSDSASGDTATDSTLQAALLDVSDINGFVAGKPDTTDNPLPCTPDEPSLTKQFPPDGKAQTTFDSDSGKSTFEEQLFRYSQESTAIDTIGAAIKGLDCKTGTFGTTSATIVGVGELTTTPSVDSAEQWDFKTSDGTLGTAIIARKGSVVIGLSFAANQSGASEIIPLKVLNLALQKLAAS